MTWCGPMALANATPLDADRALDLCKEIKRKDRPDLSRIVIKGFQVRYMETALRRFGFKTMQRPRARTPLHKWAVRTAEVGVAYVVWVTDHYIVLRKSIVSGPPLGARVRTGIQIRDNHANSDLADHWTRRMHVQGYWERRS